MDSLIDFNDCRTFLNDYEGADTKLKISLENEIYMLKLGRKLDDNERNLSIQAITVSLPNSKLCFLSSPPAGFIKGSSKVVRIDEVRIEEECREIAPDGCQPDAMLRMGSIWVALEIRVSHKKALEDVSKFAAAGIGVIEIFLKGIAESEDLHSALFRRISGLSLEGQDKFFGREWLYSPSMRIDLLENWHLCRGAQSPGLEGIVSQSAIPITVFAATCGRLEIAPGKPTADRQAITNADEAVRQMKAEYDAELAKKTRLKESPRNSVKHPSTTLGQQKTMRIDTKPGKSAVCSSFPAKEPKKPGLFDKALSKLRKALHRG